MPDDEGLTDSGSVAPPAKQGIKATTMANSDMGRKMRRPQDPVISSGLQTNHGWPTIMAVRPRISERTLTSLIRMPLRITSERPDPRHHRHPRAAWRVPAIGPRATKTTEAVAVDWVSLLQASTMVPRGVM